MTAVILFWCYKLYGDVTAFARQKKAQYRKAISNVWESGATLYTLTKVDEASS